MLQAVNHRVRRGFSKSARQYDLLTGLHREIADKLFEQVIKRSNPVSLLDVGCGTGYLTLKAKKHFPQSKIIGLDFSPGMLKAAGQKHEDIAWILGDCDQLPFSDGSFDILVSNVAYQWVGNLSHAFSEAGRVLASNGILACTIFGYHTCQELFQALGEVKAGQLKFTRLPDENQVRRALVQSGFKNPDIDCRLMKMKFKDMHELIVWLKSIGANHLSREGYVGREMMAQAAAIYRERFPYDNGVSATFEVIQVHAQK